MSFRERRTNRHRKYRAPAKARTKGLPIPYLRRVGGSSSFPLEMPDRWPNFRDLLLQDYDEAFPYS